MKKIISLLIIALFASCSTMKKSVIYPAIGGALLGGFIGKELSPNKESEALNTLMGASVGSAIMGASGYMFYKSANPDLDMKDSPIRNQYDAPAPILEPDTGNTGFKILPSLKEKGSKNYISSPNEVPQEVQGALKPQYYQKYEAEPYTFEANGKTFSVPSLEVIEVGVEK